MSMMITDPEGIKLFRLTALVSALRLELNTGMKHSRVNVFRLVKNEFNLKGNKTKIVEQMQTILVERQNAYKLKKLIA